MSAKSSKAIAIAHPSAAGADSFLALQRAFRLYSGRFTPAGGVLTKKSSSQAGESFFNSRNRVLAPGTIFGSRNPISGAKGLTFSLKNQILRWRRALPSSEIDFYRKIRFPELKNDFPGLRGSFYRKVHVSRLKNAVLASRGKPPRPRGRSPPRPSCLRSALSRLSACRRRRLRAMEEHECA